jgi:HSP20 family protein
VPRRDADRLQNEFEALFAELWNAPRFVDRRGAFQPSVDTFVSGEPPELTVLVELPGVDPASVSLVVGGRALLVSGERPRPSGQGRLYQQMEIAYGPFARRIRLPADVDPEHARAEYERGVLRVSLPLAEAPARGRIAIAFELK